MADSPDPHSRRKPNTRTVLRERFFSFIENQRLRTAHTEALPQLALIGLVCGLLAGAIIIAFRAVVEAGQTVLLADGGPESFEALAPAYRFLLAVVGAVLVGALFQAAPAAARRVGIVHLIERLSYHQGSLPFRNAAMQFVGAAISIVSGHSVGREGPSIHLGAASASLLGRFLGLPNNSMRTLIGCGVAAAIAAGFNTPLAGVVFAMEVVLMEYTITGFAPIIVAAVGATTLTRVYYGEDPAFFVPLLDWTSVLELPYVLAIGGLGGALAAAFIHLLMWTTRLTAGYNVWLRAVTAGALVGLIAIPVPAVMGIGYDTVNAAMLGEISLVPLIAIVAAKLVATALSIGLGLPGGLIAPTLVIGAAAGGAMGLLVTITFGVTVSQGFYAMLGMGAVMGATLQAPLAALVAMLELTANPNIILPGMIAVISAVLVTRIVFGRPSVYRLLLQASGQDYRDDPIAQALRRVGVASVMDRNISRQGRKIPRATATRVVDDKRHWVVIRDGRKPIALLPATDLAHHLADSDAEIIDLMEIPAKRKDLAPITVLESLQEALEELDKTGKEVLYVTGARGGARNKIYGIITRADIEKTYRPG